MHNEKNEEKVSIFQGIGNFVDRSKEEMYSLNEINNHYTIMAAEEFDLKTKTKAKIKTDYENNPVILSDMVIKNLLDFNFNYTEEGIFFISDDMLDKFSSKNSKNKEIQKVQKSRVSKDKKRNPLIHILFDEIRQFQITQLDVYILSNFGKEILNLQQHDKKQLILNIISSNNSYYSKDIQKLKQAYDALFNKEEPAPVDDAPQEPEMEMGKEEPQVEQEVDDFQVLLDKFFTNGIEKNQNFNAVKILDLSEHVNNLKQDNKLFKNKRKDKNYQKTPKMSIFK